MTFDNVITLMVRQVFTIAFIAHGTLNNFKVKSGEEGHYKITLKQLKETISIVKQ